MPHADEGDALCRLACILLLTLLVGLIREVGEKFLQICLGGDAINRHDLNHSAIQLPVPQIALRERLNFQSSDQKIARLYGITEEIVIVYVIDLEASVLDIFLGQDFNFFSRLLPIMRRFF